MSRKERGEENETTSFPPHHTSLFLNKCTFLRSAGSHYAHSCACKRCTDGVVHAEVTVDASSALCFASTASLRGEKQQNAVVDA